VKKSVKKVTGVNGIMRGPNPVFLWAPRVLAMAFIAFLFFFSLDAVNEKVDFWETAPNLFMHNIPALVLLAALIISWKYELAGAIVFTLTGVLYVTWLLNTPRLGRLFVTCLLTVAFPASLTGVLFFVNWMLKKCK